MFPCPLFSLSLGPTNDLASNESVPTADTGGAEETDAGTEKEGEKARGGARGGEEVEQAV